MSRAPRMRIHRGASGFHARRATAPRLDTRRGRVHLQRRRIRPLRGWHSRSRSHFHSHVPHVHFHWNSGVHRCCRRRRICGVQMRTRRGQWWLSQVARSLMMLVRVHSRRHSRRLTLRQPLLVEEKLLALELHAHVR